MSNWYRVNISGISYKGTRLAANLVENNKYLSNLKFKIKIVQICTFLKLTFSQGRDNNETVTHYPLVKNRINNHLQRQEKLQADKN